MDFARFFRKKRLFSVFGNSIRERKGSLIHFHEKIRKVFGCFMISGIQAFHYGRMYKLGISGNFYKGFCQGNGKMEHSLNFSCGIIYNVQHHKFIPLQRNHKSKPNREYYFLTVKL